jgi:hypothetical protein
MYKKKFIFRRPHKFNTINSSLIVQIIRNIINHMNIRPMRLKFFFFFIQFQFLCHASHKNIIKRIKVYTF